MVGFIFAFLAQYHGRLAHWSHMMAVEAKYRDQGFGFKMKLVHRQVALERGIKSICWTFDPLQSRNARLNISRLGALAEEYVPDCYGRFPSLLEKGLPSDRWVVNWRISTARVEERLRGETPPFDPALPRVNDHTKECPGLPAETWGYGWTSPTAACWWKSPARPTPCGPKPCPLPAAGGWKPAGFFNTTSPRDIA